MVALAATGCSEGNRASAPKRAAQDSPRLVFNRSIGDVRVSMSRADVELRYGRPAREQVLRGFFPVGTRYQGKELVRAVYRLHGGVLEAEYVGGNVKTIRTTSAYYRTVSGIGVGAHVPRDRCVRMNDTGEVGPRGCKNTWLSFDFDGECLDAWLTSMGTRTMTLLFMHRGRRIEAVRIGDPDVILPCF